MATEAEKSQLRIVPADIKQQHMEAYDIIAEKYNAWTTQYDHRRLSNLAELYVKVPELATGDGSVRVLELGCGSGFPVMDKLLADNPNLTAIANDMSSKQLDLCQQNLAPYAPRVEFAPGDMANLTFPSDSFDAVIALYSFLHLPLDEQATMIAKIQKWLRPGGCLLANFPKDDVAWKVWDLWLDEGIAIWHTGLGVEGTVKMVTEKGLEVEKAEVEGDGTQIFLWVIARKR